MPDDEDEVLQGTDLWRRSRGQAPHSGTGEGPWEDLVASEALQRPRGQAPQVSHDKVEVVVASEALQRARGHAPRGPEPGGVNVLVVNTGEADVQTLQARHQGHQQEVEKSKNKEKEFFQVWPRGCASRGRGGGAVNSLAQQILILCPYCPILNTAHPHWRRLGVLGNGGEGLLLGSGPTPYLPLRTACGVRCVTLLEPLSQLIPELPLLPCLKFGGRSS